MCFRSLIFIDLIIDGEVSFDVKEMRSETVIVDNNSSEGRVFESSLCSL